MRCRLNTLLFASFLAASFMGCAASQTPAPSPAPKQQAYTIKTPKDMMRVVDKNVAPPVQLTNIQNNAAGLIDDVKIKDWKKVNDKLKKIKSEYTILNPMLQISAASKKLINDMSKTITSLEKQVNAKKTYESMLDANKITKYALDTQDIYKISLPTEIGKIGYHTRQIALDAEKVKWTDAKSNLGSIERLWVSLKPKLNSTYNADKTKLSSAINDLKRSITDKSSSKIRTNTKRLENNLTIIGSDFKKQLGIK